MVTLGEPETGEYAPHFEPYVALVRGPDVIETLERQCGTVGRMLAAVSEEREGFRYAAGKWSIREVVGHLCDAERVFAYRALTFARGGKSALPSFDENEFARLAGHDAVPLRSLAEEFLSVREATLHLLRHLPAEVCRREGTAGGHPVTVRALAYIAAGHVAHHLVSLRERYAVADPGPS
jgi:hypothetical protein